MRTHFGSWTAALREAGVPPRRRPSWTREEIGWAIQHWAVEHGGEPPRYKDFR